MQKIKVWVLAVCVTLGACLAPNQLTALSQECKTSEEVYKVAESATVLVVSMDENFRALSFGTGLVVDDKGTVITSTHVINNSDNIGIVTMGKTTYRYKLKKLGRQISVSALTPYEEKVFPPAYVSLQPIDAHTGELIYSLGHPVNHFGFFSQGLVSTVYEKEMITLSLVGNHGSSGSAVFNCRGEVVGFIVMKDRDTPNVLFANPVQDAIDQLN